MITKDDKDTLKDITDYRNSIAHELMSFLINSEKEIEFDKITNIYDLLTKIEKWWIIEVEIPTEPDMTIEKIKEIDIERVKSMRMMTLEIILSIVTSDDPEFINKSLKNLIKKN